MGADPSGAASVLAPASSSASAPAERTPCPAAASTGQTSSAMLEMFWVAGVTTAGTESAPSASHSRTAASMSGVKTSTVSEILQTSTTGNRDEDSKQLAVNCHKQLGWCSYIH